MAPRANWKGYLRLSLVSWMSRVGPKPPSSFAGLRRRHVQYRAPDTARQQARVRRRSTGGNISPMTLNLNGQRGRGGL
jgi:non-homologous end joining protein Ku